MMIQADITDHMREQQRTVDQNCQIAKASMYIT